MSKAQYDTQEAVRKWERIDLTNWEHSAVGTCAKLRPHYTGNWVCDTCGEKVRVRLPL